MCLNYRMVIKLALVRPVAQLGKLSVSKKGGKLSSVCVFFIVSLQLHGQHGYCIYREH